jgi:hypothetical protein
MIFDGMVFGQPNHCSDRPGPQRDTGSTAVASLTSSRGVWIEHQRGRGWFVKEHYGFVSNSFGPYRYRWVARYVAWSL